MRTLGQKRAEFAFGKVNAFKEKPKATEYKSLVKGFGSMIMNNGLGQSLAFLKAKKKDHHLELYKNINEWFLSDNSPIRIAKDDLLQEIMLTDSNNYRYLTEEALLLINWFKKFVDAEIASK